MNLAVIVFHEHPAVECPCFSNDSTPLQNCYALLMNWGYRTSLGLLFSFLLHLITLVRRLANFTRTGRIVGGDGLPDVMMGPAGQCHQELEGPRTAYRDLLEYSLEQIPG